MRISKEIVIGISSMKLARKLIRLDEAETALKFSVAFFKN